MDKTKYYQCNCLYKMSLKCHELQFRGSVQNVFEMS
jgi:hypothetical protein